MASETAGREPLSAATRRRLQQCFEHGSKSASQGNFDYAENMFTQCVVGDPANVIYTKQFIDTERQKYNHNKKGSKLASFKGAGTKTSIKKASMSKDWTSVITSGLEMLKLNPWDVPTLSAMANACQELGFDECQLIYLKAALDTNSKDANINRLCGRALARMGQFDQAIACWRRVAEAKPGDDEAQRAIGDLAVEKTISHGGYEKAESSNEVRADRGGADDSRDAKLTPEQRLEKVIAKHPEELSNYLDLADLHMRNERFAEAEETLTKALQVSGGDVAIRETLEDAQLRRGTQQLMVAEKRAEQEHTSEADELVKRMRAELNRVEMEVYRSRSERYPTNLGLKYELGVRLKRARQFKEAIQCFQAARADTKRAGAVRLALGECFQYLEQYRLALAEYEHAIEKISEREVEPRKLALYRAGVLSMAVKDLEKADKYLSELASREFGYKDVAQRLDKIAKMRHKG